MVYRLIAVPQASDFVLPAVENQLTLIPGSNVDSCGDPRQFVNSYPEVFRRN